MATGISRSPKSAEASPILIQSPEVVKVPGGVTVRIQCAFESSNVNNTVQKYSVHWYHPQNKSHIILSHFVDGRVSRARGLSDRFQPSRDVPGNSYILTVRDVKLGDSAVYICGIWGKIFGNGTRLNVTSANTPVLIQSPSLERVPEGQTARLQCTMRNAAVTHTDVHWNRELPGKDMERVLTHDIKNNTRRSPGFTERFHPSRDTSNKTFILTISNVQPSDAAVYYCSVWGDISGNGSQLSVTMLDVGLSGELKRVWIIVGAVLGAALFPAAVILSWIRRDRFRKQQSSCPHLTGDNILLPDYENISHYRHTQKSDDFQVDANLIYMNVSARSKAPSR
ncbi:uncharacterized protein [Scyliorhinus torazame]|uniref:uncharacterized protein n=1 Tax=Scyliorhinus torazame TaxID=75743 RepID=UPI003B594E70